MTEREPGDAQEAARRLVDDWQSILVKQPEVKGPLGTSEAYALVFAVDMERLRRRIAAALMVEPSEKETGR